MNFLIASIGSLAIAASPFWAIALAELPDIPRRRRPLFLAFVAVAALITLAAGVLWVWVRSADVKQLAELYAFSTVLTGGTAPYAALETLSRLRKRRREAWRKAHPDEDPIPTTRLERHVAKELDAVRRWYAEASQQMASDVDSRGWVGHSLIARLDDSRPSVPRLGSKSARVARFLDQQSCDTRAAVESWAEGIEKRAAQCNADHLADVAQRESAFFATVETTPLTDEQIEAVVCMDDRVRLIAAAGSGKTSTLVAKAAYAVHQGLVSPERILVLAFNDGAASEARDRLRKRLRLLGREGAVEASTFHALGMKLVGRSRGRKPTTARAVAQDRRMELLAEIVAELVAGDAAFAADWAFFRAVWADFDDQDDQEASSRHDDALATLAGVPVKSRGERLIADWLWFQGVDFEYERPYLVDTADVDHQQYHPDFYYPAVDLWHEHFALDEHGAAPAEFQDYADGVVWKREQHAANGTRLLETTMAQIDDGTALPRLSEALLRLGVVFRPDPDRPPKGRPLVPQAQLHDLFGKALATSKRDGIGAQDLQRRASGLRSGAARARARAFVRLLEPIWAEWDRRLAADGEIDFEGMVVEAAEALESGRVTPDYDLILVDEFQDLNAPFARILAGLLQRPGARLFAVGDDWQAINGFAGADVRALLDFELRFGTATTLRLERTFRSSQPICDVAGAFVTRNPAQLPKSVSSDAECVPSAVRVQIADSRSAQSASISSFLADLQQRIDRARAAGRREPDRSVLILGRYNYNRDLVPELSRYPALRCEFSSVHKAKGREADYVVIVDVVNGSDGFPSRKLDDPVLRMLAPTPDAYPHAEERRLLYVAMTRARRAVLVLSVKGSLSPFATELCRIAGVDLQDGRGGSIELCPTCGAGVLHPRVSAYGPFVVCDRPSCGYKHDARKVSNPPWHRTPVRGAGSMGGGGVPDRAGLIPR